MRNDLTQNFIDAMGANPRTPLQYMIFHFSLGDIYVSDRELIVDGNICLPIVENWGDIITSGSDISDLIQETLELQVSLLNTKPHSFGDNFIYQEPINLKVSIYQTFENLDIIDRALIGVFVIQDHFELSESSRIITLDLVTENMVFSDNIGDILTKENYPNALDSDVNKGIDLIIGSPGEVQTLCVKTPKKCTLKGTILKLNTIANVYENLNDLNFEQVGYIVIEKEILGYASRDEDTFTITERGAFGTIPKEHRTGSEILEYITDHTFIIGKGPLQSISNIKVGGLPFEGNYSTDLTSDVATIVFPTQPQFERFSRSARDIDIEFDTTVIGNNTAWQPHYSYSPDERAKGAVVSKIYPQLAIRQENATEDIGELIRAFLVVEHWATNVYENDVVSVWVEGLGEVGNLSKPNPKDIADLQATINIDHDHVHRTGGIHGHGFNNPSISTVNPAHNHPISATGTTYTDSTGGYSLPHTVYPHFTNVWSHVGTGTRSITFKFSVPSTVTSQRVNIALYAGGVKEAWIYVGNEKVLLVEEWNATTKNVWIDLIPRRTQITFYWTRYTGTVGAKIIIRAFTLESTKPPEVDNRITEIDSSLSNDANVLNQNVGTDGRGIKDSDDVVGLSTGNRPLEDIVTSSSSRSLVESFDLTKHLESINWNWFANREIRLIYNGSTNNADIVITRAYFKGEYREREIVNTNNVTLEPVGSIPNRPDLTIQHILNEIAGMPLSKMESIYDPFYIGGDIPGTQFDIAASKYIDLNYQLDGVISAKDSIGDVLKNILKQCRSRIIWSAGKIKLGLREKAQNWEPIREIGKTDTQLKSIKIEKERVDRLRNDIDLFFNFDRISNNDEEESFNSTVSLKDQNSIDKHGKKKNNKDWFFDLVRSESMARDLLDYYLWRYGESSTIYKFTSYLPHFDIEKGDIVRFTSDFLKTSKVPVRILENKRIFGSGKNNKINTIEFIAESIRLNKIHLVLEDTLNVQGSIDIDYSYNPLFVDEILLEEKLSFSTILNLTDNLTVEESLNTRLDFILNFSDTATLYETFGGNHILNLADNLFLNDSIFYAEALAGFGLDAFGTSPFGSAFQNNIDFQSTLVVEEEIQIIIN